MRSFAIAQDKRLTPNQGFGSPAYFSKTVCSETSVSNALRALVNRFLLISLSSSNVSAGFPRGCGIAIVGTILLAPTVKDIGTTVHICTTGIPALSISFTIVAPQRVQVPQVDVRITASTPSANNSLEKFSANPLAFLTAVPLPTVV